MALHILLLALLVVFLLLAVLLTDLLRAAIALAIGSAVLSMLFFWFHVPYAAVFELSVCAGLVMVLFVSTIGLTQPPDFGQGDRPRPPSEEQGKRPLLLIPLLVLVALAVADIAVFMGMSRQVRFVRGQVGQLSFGEALWQMRWLDILGQLAAIVVGVFAVLALLRRRQDSMSEATGVGPDAKPETPNFGRDALSR
ncbi:MAG: NADH-quinone oxidoreductase subunit J [candidate division WOR-3 bacterium]